MAYTLSEAAQATGKSKSTILRAIQGGKLTAARRETDQGWLIEPAELHRLYAPIAAEPLRDAAEDEARNGDNSLPVLAGNNAGEIAALRELLDDRETTIADLRWRLDREAEERRQAQAQLTALLTDQRPAPARGLWWRMVPWRAARA